MVRRLTRKQAKAELDIIVVNLGTLMVISGSFSTVMRQMETSVESCVFGGASAHKAANSRLGRVLAPEGERVISRARVVHAQNASRKELTRSLINGAEQDSSRSTGQNGWKLAAQAECSCSDLLIPCSLSSHDTWYFP